MIVDFFSHRHIIIVLILDSFLFILCYKTKKNILQQLQKYYK